MIQSPPDLRLNRDVTTAPPFAATSASYLRRPPPPRPIITTTSLRSHHTDHLLRSRCPDHILRRARLRPALPVAAALRPNHLRRALPISFGPTCSSPLARPALPLSRDLPFLRPLPPSSGVIPSQRDPVLPSICKQDLAPPVPLSSHPSRRRIHGLKNIESRCHLAPTVPLHQASGASRGSCAPPLGSGSRPLPRTAQGHALLLWRAAASSGVQPPPPPPPARRHPRILLRAAAQLLPMEPHRRSTQGIRSLRAPPPSHLLTGAAAAADPFLALSTLTL
ncbi:hypothetical protein VPH35_089485 [Triticum aestivum]